MAEAGQQSRWEKLASEEQIAAARQALESRGIGTDVVDNRAQALEKLKTLVPAGAELMTGGSTTLKEIGFVDLLKSRQHPWRNLKDAILAEKDPARQAELRSRSVVAEYFLGSVHAAAETGEIVVASASGSQLPAYVYTSPNVIWIVGTQKIVPNLDEAIRRVREHCLPLEDARVKALGMAGSTIGKLLIFEREISPDRKLTLIFVREKLGF